MSVIDKIKKLGKGVLDLVFPISCLVCGTDGTYLCQTCLPKLPRLEKQQCLVCQTPAPFGKTHAGCASRNSVDGAIAALTHKDKQVQKIIRTFKYNFISDLASPLAAVAWQELEKQGLAEYFQNFAIVPVPLHPRRANWRGFNQADLLARALADKLQITISDQMVKRRKFTVPQTTLTALERKKNMDDAFELMDIPENKKILLIDDVVTSGSTANELAKLFKQAKASEVWLLTAAHG